MSEPSATSQSTGSYPPGQKGLHRRIRQQPLSVPTIAPRFCTASMKYSEQDGMKRQVRGSHGESRRW